MRSKQLPQQIFKADALRLGDAQTVGKADAVCDKARCLLDGGFKIDALYRVGGKDRREISPVPWRD